MSKKQTPLEAFKRIKNHCEKDFIQNMLYGYEKELKIIKTELKNVEKYKKALDIIKKKKVNVYILLLSINVEDYNRYNNFDFRDLTQEEFDLLKEILVNENF